MNNKIESILAEPQTLLVKKNGTIDLKKYGTVLGFSIECTDNSGSDAKFSYNDGVLIPLPSGAQARSFGGFFGNVPARYEGRIKITFDNPAASPLEVLVIITSVTC